MSYFDETSVLVETDGVPVFIIPEMFLVKKQMLDKKLYLMLVLHLGNNLNNTLKTSTSLNAFKQNIILVNYFNELKKKESQ